MNPSTNIDKPKLSKNRRIKIDGTESLAQAIDFYRRINAMQTEWEERRRFADDDSVLVQDINLAIGHLCELAAELIRDNAAEPLQSGGKR